MVQWQQQGFYLSLRHTHQNHEEELSVRWESGNRHCQVNRQPIEKLEEFWGRFPLVLLAADDQLLIRGPAVRRQQWLDSLIAYRDATYLLLVLRYNATLRQRNAWLRQGAFDQRLGEALTEQLTETGLKITHARTQMLHELRPCLDQLGARLLPADRKLILDYRPSFSTQELPGWTEIRKNELRLGRSLLGPHRDEIGLTLRDKPLARYGSEGEQRMGALLLRLTEVHAIHQARGEWPILLLDDVLNPLDASRKIAWTQEIPSEVQVILATTAWPSDFATPEKWTAWELNQGTLKEL